jgi:hypothetical protein
VAKNWRDSIPSQWLKACDFDEGPALMTIRKFSVEKIGDDQKPVVWFDEVDKGLGLNIINGSTIEEICGTADPLGWRGHKIVLFKTQTDYQGKRVDCVRIRAPKPGSVPAQPVAPAEAMPSDDDVPF